MGTIPITTCECERSISVIRRLKTYMESRMTESRFNSLALMSIHQEIIPELERVLNIFSVLGERRLELSPLSIFLNFSKYRTINESEVLENVSVKTDNGFNNEKKLMNGTEVLKNVFVKTDDGLNDQTLSKGYEELLNSITNKNEKAAAEKILNSPLKDLTNTAKLFEMINTENHGLAINDIINSDDLDLTEQDKVQINLAFVGGGDPAQKFIETLVQEQPKLPISDLENALKTNNVCYDKLTNSDETISNLKYNWIKSLCVKLNFDSKWRNVASTLGYTQQKIISFQLSQKRENNYSQAERLFSTIQHRKPNLSVKGFMDILHSLNQENIYQHMIIMVKQAAKKVTVPIGNQETSKNNQD
ncbi:uncharacterized protein LOC124816075 [Hydra vulgaris]|uniref:uncharacterized protein LOC124816075 n=1 Tax=Hydra vulgaris TaxID=6087 RepID=UPI001F5F644F|nr:uncharacterized protein LOC124816075 [Hydra vulgaris]